MNEAERLQLITQIKDYTAGRALIEHLSIAYRKLLVELTQNVEPTNSGRIGQIQGEISALRGLEALLEADFEFTLEEMEEQAA